MIYPDLNLVMNSIRIMNDKDLVKFWIDIFYV